MHSPIVPLIVLLCCVFILGCKPIQLPLERRRLNTIHYVEKYWAESKAELENKFANDILAILRTAPIHTLSKPTIASAALAGIGSVTNVNHLERYMLDVLWLEDWPSVDGVELGLPELGESIDLDIAPADITDNKKSANELVVFAAGFDWKKGSQVGKKLTAHIDKGNITIRLLRHGNPVTEPCPVNVLIMNHWVRRIPTPHEGPSSSNQHDGGSQ